MAAVPQHLDPEGPQGCYDTWRARGRICVPSQGRTVVDLPIAQIYRVSEINGLPLQILIETAPAQAELMKRFGVVFSATRPGDIYPIHVLWKRDSKVGSWLTRKRAV